MLKAKKSLGQNFLQNEEYIERILEHADIAGDTVLEIGPGLGALTVPLLEQAKKVIAIETDERFYETLQAQGGEKLTLIADDILQVDVDALLVNQEIATHQYSVVANIPYYITAPIIRTLLALKNTPKQIILMVQDEVAERLIARPGTMSLLSVMAQYNAKVEKLFFVPKEAFVPMPKVNSAVVRIVPEREIDTIQEKRFFRVVKAGFQAKRKTLANNLKSLTGKPKDELEAILTHLGLRPDIRAQALSIEDWERLVECLFPTEK